jgi:hypothetical protein
MADKKTAGRVSIFSATSLMVLKSYPINLAEKPLKRAPKQ